MAIKNSKCVGWKLYEKGGMTKERLVEFLEEFIFGKYKNHIIILDNAGSHRNNYVKDAITESENKYLFSVPYTPKTNVVEMFFNQIKHYLKLNKKVLRFDDLKKEVKKAIKKVKEKIIKITFFMLIRKNELHKEKRGVSSFRKKT